MVTLGEFGSLALPFSVSRRFVLARLVAIDLSELAMSWSRPLVPVRALPSYRAAHGHGVRPYDIITGAVTCCFAIAELKKQGKSTLAGVMRCDMMAGKAKPQNSFEPAIWRQGTKSE